VIISFKLKGDSNEQKVNWKEYPNLEPLGWDDCEGYGLKASIVYLYYYEGRLEGIFYKEKDGKYIRDGSICVNYDRTPQGWFDKKYTHGSDVYQKRCFWLSEMQRLIEERNKEDENKNNE